MRFQKYKIACLTTLLFLSSVASPEEVQISKSAESEKVSGSRVALDPQDEYALHIRKMNAKSALPDLMYWGVQEYRWGVEKDELPPLSEEEFAGMSFSYAHEFDKKTEGLDATKWVFDNALDAKGLEEIKRLRAVRFTRYKKIKSKLIAKYGYPTHPFRPEDGTKMVFDESYVRGLDDRYLIAWRGPETAVELSLSDVDLSVRFSRQPTSTAQAKMNAAMRAAEAIEN